MVKLFKEFLCDETGAIAAEYALVLGLLGAAITAAAAALGGAISSATDNASTEIVDCIDGC